MINCSDATPNVDVWPTPIQPINLLALLPIFAPATGGCAEYGRFICDHVEPLDIVKKLTLITESWPGEPRTATIHSVSGSGSILLERQLTRFLSLSERTLYRYVAFARQNCDLVNFLRTLRNEAHTTVLLIHGAFFFHPSLLAPTLRRLKKNTGRKLVVVLDARDPAIPPKRLAELDFLDAAISCGTRITRLLEQSLQPDSHVIEIPVPLDYYQLREQDLENVLTENKLKPQGYIFSPNGIQDHKQFPLIFDTWLKLVQNNAPLDLVVAGNTSDWRARYQTIHSTRGRLINLGRQPNFTVRALMQSAAAVINPSRVEGLPRSCLEALSCETPTLLPPGIPEFADLDQQFIAESDDPGQLARQLAYLIQHRLIAPYNVRRHDARHISWNYAQLLTKLGGE